MSTDNLNSILELGWQSSREAWQLLAPNDDGEFTTTGAKQTGQAMDQLAYDLRQLGHVKPARLAYSAAFVLNSLAEGTIAFAPDIAEKTSEIVTVLAEMLLELEAAKPITTQEPITLVDELKENWGLRLAPEEPEPIPIEPPSEVDHVLEPMQAVESELVIPKHTELVTISEDLVEASGSLLERVIREGEFPHTAALGRIHHLATRVRDQVVGGAPAFRSGTAPGIFTELRPMVAPDPVSVPIAEVHPVEDPLRLVEKHERPEPQAATQPPGVLIVDRSPFIRMLLTTAIEAAGYVAVATADFDESSETQSQRPWNIVICGDTTAIGLQSLANFTAAWQGCLITFGEQPIDGANCEQHQCRRSDLDGLLNLIKSKLGPRQQSLLMSA